jgi:hypothetical protein
MSEQILNILNILKKEYFYSDVVSGEFIFSTELSLEFSKAEVREGIQAFLDWDESPATFKLERGETHWIVED